MIKSFTKDAWNDYLYWQKQDKKTLNKINQLINEITRSPFEGIGKPESLKHNFQGAWSRRIDDKNRIIYMVKNKEVYFLSFKDHYDDK